MRTFSVVKVGNILMSFRLYSPWRPPKRRPSFPNVLEKKHRKRVQLDVGSSGIFLSNGSWVHLPRTGLLR